MTALNAFVDHDAVHISTDGAGYLRSGKIVRWLNKTALLPHLNAAIGARGMQGTLDKLVTRSQDAESFDHLVQTLPERLAPIAMWWQFEAVIAGWSAERQAPEAYVVSSRGKFRQTINQMQVPKGNAFLAPFDGELQARCERHGVRVDMPEPERDAFIIMNEQRQVYADGRFFKVPVVGVGGFCQLTTITQFQTTTRVVGRWDDQIGSPVSQ